MKKKPIESEKEGENERALSDKEEDERRGMKRSGDGYEPEKVFA